jgi:ATP-dependent helicase HrpB
MQSQLPIHAILPEVKAALQAGNKLIVQADPGAGKSTVLPLALLDLPGLENKKIILVEPRRLAAVSVAERLAAALNEAVGQTIGYRIRFDAKVSAHTRIEVVTEGIFAQRLLDYEAMEATGAVILDEFHERSLSLDTAFVKCMEYQKWFFPEMRILLMSATLEAERIAPVMDHCPVIRSSGRQYPVDIQYHPPPPGDMPLPAVVSNAVKRAMRETQGDMLVFLPGIADIRKAEDLLQPLPDTYSLHTLFGDMPFADQQAALLPDAKGKRKIVLSTSIAETSLTLQGITLVIDSGMARVPVFDARSGLTRLQTVPISKDAADQRSGRAGRTQPGTAWRLWSQVSHAHLAPARKPEILDADLTALYLQIADFEVSPIESLSWIDKPPAAALHHARNLLTEMGALKDDTITETGKHIVRMPAHPRIANMMRAAQKANLSACAADIAALLEEKDPCQHLNHADILSRLDALHAFRNKEHLSADKRILDRIERISAQWRKSLKVSKPADTANSYEEGFLIACAYPERVAKRMDGQADRYKLANGRFAKLQAHDPLSTQEWISIALMDAGTNEGKIFLAAPLDIQQLQAQFNIQHSIHWDENSGQLQHTTDTVYGGLKVKRSRLPDIPPDVHQAAMLQILKSEGLSLFGKNEAAEQLICRVQSLRHWHPDEDWPDMDTPTLLQDAETWYLPFTRNIRNRQDFSKLSVFDMLMTRLSWAQQQELDARMPEKIEVPTGNHIRLQYFPDGSTPVLAVRLQEIFGMLDTPRIDHNRIPLMLHLLSPAYRPAQVTQDLKSFWSSTYFEVRKDLRGKYPKHAWPEDPLQAQPTAKRKPKGT